MQTLVVYVTRSGAKVPMCIDTVVEQPDGQYGEFSGKRIDSIIAQNPGAAVCTMEQFQALHDSAWASEPAQISKEDFDRALEALPPVNWRRLGGFECFAFLECLSGQMTTIYARVRDVHWSFVGHKDMTTDQIMDKLEQATRKALTKLSNNQAAAI